MTQESHLESSIWSFSAVGQDRPGIVAALSKVFFAQGCNLLDSSMTKLANQFAIVMLLEISPTTKPQALRQALDKIGQDWGLNVATGPIVNDHLAPDIESGPPQLVSIYGGDQAGLTAKVTDVIARNQWNVTDLSTKQIPGSIPVYILLLEIVAGPQSQNLLKLKEELSTLGAQLGCSVTIKNVESAHL